MNEYDYQNFAHRLNRLKPPLPPVWLIYGEELLCQEAVDQLVARLLPDDPHRLAYEPLAGDTLFGAVLEKVQTHAFLGAGRVVALLDARLFDSKKDVEKLVARSQKAYLKEDLNQAARLMARVLQMSGFIFADVVDTGRREKLLGPWAKEGETWVGAVINHGVDQGIKIPQEKSVAEMLEAALATGFPAGNILIMQCQSADRRRRLYKIIAAKGSVVDCTVPTGTRMADQKVQDKVLQLRSRKILARHQKKMGALAFNALKDKTGFSLRNFSTRLELLVAYVGERPEITAQDVARLLKRTKDDPIYMLTDAMGLRQLKQSRFYLKTLLAQNVAPLQVLGALANQIRKLIVARDFLDSPHGQSWRPGLSYHQFRQRVLPAIETFDREFIESLQSWDRVAINDRVGGEQQERSKKKKKAKAPESDLYLAPNPQNSYPVYLLVKKAAAFSAAQLSRLLATTHEADQRLKLGRHHPELVLGRILLEACNPMESRG